MPPSLTIGILCCPLNFGLSNRLYLYAIFLKIGVSFLVTTLDIKNVDIPIIIIYKLELVYSNKLESIFVYFI